MAAWIASFGKSPYSFDNTSESLDISSPTCKILIPSYIYNSSMTLLDFLSLEIIPGFSFKKFFDLDMSISLFLIFQSLSFYKIIHL